MIGLLKNRVQVQKVERLSNGRGGWTVYERDLGYKWAAILPLSTSEITEYMQLEKNITARIIMRRDPDIDNHCKFIYKNSIYSIDNIVDRLDHSDYIEILVTGEKANG